MNKTKVVQCGVIGNPIEHSQSSIIHQGFAEQFGIHLDYQKYLVEQKELYTFVQNFFAKGGQGLNVTLPFKQDALNIAKNNSPEAIKCQSVNTLFLNKKNEICGDTTDGKGLLVDLQSKNFAVKNKSILIVGAGGATTSILYALLKEGANITLHNRTLEKIETIKNNFSDIGKVNIFKQDKLKSFDGIITATSQFNKNLLRPIIKSTHSQTFIYDLNYKERAQETLNFFQGHGLDRLSDGYGMLIAQAAISFSIWHGMMPNINR